jgi:tetratricopeptide (TPR) repeat protein
MAEALALWPGPAYGEFTYEEFARAEVERLDALREVARKRWLEARLALGEEAAAQALALVAEQPLDERAHQLAMLALYRAGRHSEALDLYRALRARLTDDLGLEPGPETRDVHAKILRHDPSLTPAVIPRREWPPLPAPPNRLIGRERELADVRRLLATAHVRLVVLTGAGGSGETRLALELARAMASEFASGAAFVSLAGVRDPELLAAAVADALGIERAAEPDPWSVVRVALQTEELLLVIDNVEHLREASPALAQLVVAAPS